jgi:hypothetical protein
MMKTMRRHAPLLMAAACLPTQVLAFGLILQYQGEEGDRELYFADIRTVSSRTPADQLEKSTEIKELDVTAVYEHARKPEFAHMKLQFQCPASYTLDLNSHKLTPHDIKVRAGDSVTFRIGQGSYKLRRADLAAEPLPVSDWQESRATVLSRAGTVACNHLDVDRALHQSIKGQDFDFEGFGKQLAQLGLPSDMVLIGQTTPPEFLDFAWSQFWHDQVIAGRRPDPSGKWHRPATEADKSAAIRRLQDHQAQVQPALDAARKSLMASIQKSQAEMAARANTTRADGKKLTPIESNLIILWRGQPEEAVVRAMGRPDFQQAADSRFLRYTKSWEKADVTLVGSRGVVASEIGGYAACFVEFRTRQDTEGQWRVDDVLVRSTYQDAGLGRTRGLCEDLASEAARNAPQGPDQGKGSIP